MPAAPGSVEEKIEVFLKGLLEHMGSAAVPHAWKDGEDSYRVELTGEDLGYLIGRRGDTLDALQHLTVAGHGLALHQRLHRVQAFAGVVAAVDLADAGVAGVVGQDDQISSEAGGVRSAQGHEHAVVARHRDHLHFGDDG